MTREEEIRNAVDTIFPIPPSEKGRTYEQALMATGFESGVKWSDTHPKSPWISIEDDLPCNHEELIDPKDPNFTVEVIARRDGGFVLSAIMVKNIKGEWKWIAGYDFTHWMPIPELPKEQED